MQISQCQRHFNCSIYYPITIHEINKNATIGNQVCVKSVIKSRNYKDIRTWPESMPSVDLGLQEALWRKT